MINYLFRELLHPTQIIAFYNCKLIQKKVTSMIVEKRNLNKKESIENKLAFTSYN